MRATMVDLYQPMASAFVAKSPVVSSYTEKLYFARRPVPEASSAPPPSAVPPPYAAATEKTYGMPRPEPPPTPGSLSDIRGKESKHAAPAFNLPPAAYSEHADRARTASATPSTNGSDSSYRPVSPTSPAGAPHKRPAAQSKPVVTKEDFTLPPPPTRSRKIIQMKPRESERQQQQNRAASVQAATSTTQPASKTDNSVQTGGKRKQAGSGTTAAGRKIARKTAHSLIERRRRSKMNEEFGVLKDMIPACRGQEMHKLAILQASIEYLQYLEKCITDLQAQNSSRSSIPPPPSSMAEPSDAADEDDELDEDEEMEDDHAPPRESANSTTHNVRPSASFVSLPPLSQITSSATNTTSPSVFSTGAGRHYSISSAASQPSYSPLYHSNQASPAFGPQLHHFSSNAQPFGPSFGLGSPALKPQDASGTQLRRIAEYSGDRGEQHHRLAPAPSLPDVVPSVSGHAAPFNQQQHQQQQQHSPDHEATAALLMLNHDRRSWRASHEHEPESARSSTGMSVKDLLSG